MAGGLKVGFGADGSAFFRTVESMKKEVSDFGRKAPRLAGIRGLSGGTLVGGVFGGIGAGAGLSSIMQATRDATKLSRGIRDLDESESKALQDLDDIHLTNTVGLVGDLEQKLKASVLPGGQQFAAQLGKGGVHPGMRAEDALFELIRTVRSLDENNPLRKQLETDFPGIRDAVEAGVTEAMFRDLAGKTSPERIREFREADKAWKEAVKKFQNAAIKFLPAVEAFANIVNAVPEHYSGASERLGEIWGDRWVEKDGSNARVIEMQRELEDRRMAREQRDKMIEHLEEMSDDG